MLPGTVAMLPHAAVPAPSPERFSLIVVFSDSSGLLIRLSYIACRTDASTCCGMQPDAEEAERQAASELQGDVNMPHQTAWVDEAHDMLCVACLYKDAPSSGTPDTQS